jgi:2-oxoglutarate ferredoxin oxidoreductase subunit delta
MKLWRKPLDADDWEAPKGKVCIIEERCKGCEFCIEFCPRKVLEESESYNSKGYHPPVDINPDDCVNCGLCELICPEFAIFVLDAKEFEREKPRKTQGKTGKAKSAGKTKTASKKGAKSTVKEGTK